MYDIRVNEPDGDVPTVTITLDALEVSDIYCALLDRNEKHRQWVLDNKRTNVEALDAVAKGHRQDGQWDALHSMMDSLFWRFIDDRDGVQ